MNLAVGIDPGSQKIGVCAIDITRGQPIAPAYGFGVLTAPSSRPAEQRLLLLGAALEHYFREVLPALFGSAAVIDLVAIEYPALSYTNKGPGKQNRHDSQFVLGMAYYMAWSVANRAADRSTVLHVTPGDASQAMGLATNALKLERNLAVAREVGGTFAYPEGHPEKGHIEGGPLNGAGPDTLDAWAIGVAGWAVYKTLKQAAALDNEGHRSHVSATNLRRPRQSRKRTLC